MSWQCMYSEWCGTFPLTVGKQIIAETVFKACWSIDDSTSAWRSPSMSAPVLEWERDGAVAATEAVWDQAGATDLSGSGMCQSECD